MYIVSVYIGVHSVDLSADSLPFFLCISYTLSLTITLPFRPFYPSNTGIVAERQHSLQEASNASSVFRILSRQYFPYRWLSSRRTSTVHRRMILETDIGPFPQTSPPTYVMQRGRIQSCLKTVRGHISAMRPIIDVLLPCALQLVRTGPLCQYELRGLFIKATIITPGRRTKASLSRTTTSCPNNPSPPLNLSATATAGAFAAHPTLVATTLLLAQARMALVHTVATVFEWWLERDVGDTGIGVKTTRRVGAQGSALRLALGVWKGGEFFRAGTRLQMGERTQAARSELGGGKDRALEED